MFGYSGYRIGAPNPSILSMEVAPAPPLVRLLAVPDLLQAVAAFIDREQVGIPY